MRIGWRMSAAAVLCLPAICGTVTQGQIDGLPGLQFAHRVWQSQAEHWSEEVANKREAIQKLNDKKSEAEGQPEQAQRDELDVFKETLEGASSTVKASVSGGVAELVKEGVNAYKREHKLYVAHYVKEFGIVDAQDIQDEIVRRREL